MRTNQIIRTFLTRTAMTLLLVSMTAVTAQAQDWPNTLVSHIECYGNERFIHIEGWVYDSFAKQWELGKEIELNAFVSMDPNDEGWDARNGILECFVRDDVNTAYGLNGKHGFRMSVELLGDIQFDDENPSRPLYVKVYATVNNGNGPEDILLNSPYTEVTAYEIGAEPATEVSEYSSQYALFTGFIATSGSPSDYPGFVDGGQSNGWYVSQGNMSVDFHSDKMIVPKGFILNYKLLGGNSSLKANKIELLAKKDIGDDWTVIYLDESQHSFSFSDNTLTIACNNDGNNPYKFFRFSMDLDGASVQYSILEELKLFGYSTQSYAVSIPSHLSPYIEANKETAYTGETVRLTLDEKIDESTLTVSDGTSNLPLTDASFRQYTFTMPAADVTVSAKYQTIALLDDDSAQPGGKKNSDIIAKKAGAANVMLKDRTIYIDGDWNTLCLPFSLASLDGTPLEEFTVKELDTETAYNGHVTGLDGTTLYLNFKDATSIEAGRPYLVMKPPVDDENTPTFTATAGTAGQTEGLDYDKLIDGDTNSRWWAPFDNIPYCEFHSDKPVYVTGYTLTTNNRTFTLNDPSVWTLSVSTDGNEPWTVIDSRDARENAADALPAARLTGKKYTVLKPGIYQYFRFEVKETVGQFDGHYGPVLNELAMHGKYLLDGGNGTHITSPVFEWVNVSADAPTPVESADGTISFVGTYSPVAISGEDRSLLFLGAANTLYYPNAAMQIGAFRAHFELNGIEAGNPASPNSVRTFALNFCDGEQTGIVSISKESGSKGVSDAWYSLDGVRLSGKPTAKGLYIHGGRKVVVP